MEILQIPTGYHLQKSGGRPTKDARDVAIFMARVLRMGSLHNQSATQADEWILGHWEKFRGKFESSDIRRSIRNTKDRTFTGKYVIAVASNELVMATPLPIVPGADVWLWCPGIPEAKKAIASEVVEEAHQEIFQMNPVALATRRYFSAS